MPQRMTKGWSSSFTDFGRRVPSPRAGPWPNLRGREEPHAAGINWDERVKGGEPGSHSGGEVGPDDRSVLKGCEVVAHYVSGKAKSAADVGYLASPVVCEILDDPRSDLVGPYFAPAVTPIIRRWSAWADCIGQFNCLSIGPYREGFTGWPGLGIASTQTRPAVCDCGQRTAVSSSLAS